MGDVLILLVESANQGIATPDGWNQVANSPQYTGTAAAAGGVRLAVFWKLVEGSVPNVSISDTGNHTTAQTFCFRGCDPSNPIHVTAGSVHATATNIWTLPAVTTTVANCLILLCIGNDRDSNSTTNLSGWSNANLSSLTERADATVNSGAGGGIGLAHGGKAVAGDTGTTQVLNAASETQRPLSPSPWPRRRCLGCRNPNQLAP
jgi:hypothetical protein